MLFLQHNVRLLILRFLCEPQESLSFSSFTPYFYLKVTKFLFKNPQLEFLVITEQNIIVYKLFSQLTFPDFSLFFT